MDGDFCILPQATPDAVPQTTSADKRPDAGYTPRPLTDKSFKGLLNTSDARLEHNYRYAPLSVDGPTNAAPHGTLYRERLAAQIELNHAPDEEHRGKQWNRRREEAIARGEDPNSQMLDIMEHRKPDSYLERGWRKLTGKAPTKAEERVRREEKERKKREKEGNKGMVHIKEGMKGEYIQPGDDGVVR